MELNGRWAAQLPCPSIVCDSAAGLHTLSSCLCRLNKCGVISPRYDVNHGEIEAWVARLLPSRLVSLLCI